MIFFWFKKTAYNEKDIKETAISLSLNTVEPLITVTSAQRPPPDLRSVKKVPAEFNAKLS